MNVLVTAMLLCNPYFKTDYKDRLSVPLKCSQHNFNAFLKQSQGFLKILLKIFKKALKAV